MGNEGTADNSCFDSEWCGRMDGGEDCLGVDDAILADSRSVFKSMDSRYEKSDISLSSTMGGGTLGGANTGRRTGGAVLVVEVGDAHDEFGVGGMRGVNDSSICLFFELLGVSKVRERSQNLCFRETQIV